MFPSSLSRFSLRRAAPVLCALLFAGLLALAGCGETAGSAAKTYSYTLPETPGGRLCVAQCSDAQNYCSQGCDLHQRECVGKVQAQALKDYDKYTRDQFAAHQPIELRPRDFERTVDCDGDKARCNADCAAPYRACYTTCGGTVAVTSSCQLLCF